MANPHYVLQWLNTGQAARLAGYHRDTIIKALESGELHGTQRVKGGRWRIAPGCLESWMTGEQCSHQAGTPEGPRKYAFLPPE